jgi:hypothetical protein
MKHCAILPSSCRFLADFCFYCTPGRQMAATAARQLAEPHQCGVVASVNLFRGELLERPHYSPDLRARVIV